MSDHMLRVIQYVTILLLLDSQTSFAQGTQTKTLVGFDTESILSSDGYPINFHIKQSANKGSFPLLVVVQGSGAQSDSNLALLASKAVNLHHIITLEKPGVQIGDDGNGVNDMTQAFNTVERKVFDHLQVFMFLRKHL